MDLLFAKLEKEHPDHFAVKQYRKFKMAAGKTLKSILISCGARLAPFDIAELRDLMAEDELELDTLGDRKSALFVILSDTDSTFNFVAALMYSQLFNLLCDKADDFYGGRLPVHVRCLLDEFANIGQIPNSEKLIATIRSREISASIILQSQSQLKTIYKDAADTIVGNCDSTLFLGGKEKSTLKEISELLGKETIDSFNQSENRGSQVSHGLTYQKLGKELMTQDELAVMDGGKCIIKDMSRFGRDYLQVGMYTEIMFPEHDIHFIAVNDGVDSTQGDNEFTPFRNIINEWYAKDTSKKIRAVMKVKGNAGEHLAIICLQGQEKRGDTHESRNKGAARSQRAVCRDLCE